MAIGMNERKNTCIDIISQNLRGFREEKEEEIIKKCLNGKVFELSIDSQGTHVI